METVPTVSEWVSEFLQDFAKLELPTGNPELRSRVQKLVEQGCDERFLLEMSYFYAYIADAFNKNAKTERSTSSSSRLVALPGLNMSRRALKNHIRDIQHDARQIERILAVARKPGKDPQTLHDAAELSPLPKLLERYCRLVADVGRACAIPHEKPLQRDRVLCSLVAHVSAVTGKPHWETLVDLINCWNLVFIKDEITLRAQSRRATGPDQLPLFRPSTVQNR